MSHPHITWPPYDFLTCRVGGGQGGEIREWAQTKPVILMTRCEDRIEVAKTQRNNK